MIKTTFLPMVPTSEVSAPQERIAELEKQLASVTADKECWLYNYRELHKNYLALDERFRKLQQDYFDLDARFLKLLKQPES